MVVTLAVAFSPIPALASPDEEAWEAWPDMPAASTVAVPGDYFMTAAITALGPFAKASDGTLYLYVQDGLVGAGMFDDLFKSEDEGRTWEATDYGADIGWAAADYIVDIACSSEDPDILYVATANRVYKTEDAGDEWDSVSTAVALAGVLSFATEVITSMDVGYVDGKPYVFIGTTDDPLYAPGGTAYRGGVYYMGDFALSGVDWTDLNVDDGAINATLDVYSLACSPNFDEDAELDVLVTDQTAAVPYTAIVNNIGAAIGVWDEVVELQTDVTGAYRCTVASEIRYVDDFDVDGDYGFFVGTNNVTGVGDGDVFFICGTTCFIDLGIDDDIASVDAVGDYGNTSLVAGAITIAPAAGITSSPVYYSTDDGATWDETDKAPTGAATVGLTTANYVLIDDDFADSGIAWCASDAATKEGAVSLTTDFGATWNGISMIDTNMTGAVYDVAFSPDYGTGDAPLFMVTESNVVAADDSVWKYDGTYCERVWYDAVNALDLVEVSPNYASDTAVFIAASATPRILYSFDGGADFTAMTKNPADTANVVKPITAWVVIDDETLITGAASGEVYKTTRYGRRCWDEVDLLGGVAITDIAVSGDTVLVGDNNSIVSISTDGGEEYDELSDGEVATLAGANDTYVAFDADYATNDTVYAASGAFVARCEIDPDEDMGDQEFDDMGALGGFAAASGLVTSEDGTLYAADATAVAGIGAAVAAVAGVPGDAFTIMATAAADNGTIQLSAGVVVVSGSAGALADVINVGAGGVLDPLNTIPGAIVPADGALAWNLPGIGDWLTFTCAPAAPPTYGTYSIVGAAPVAIITADADGDASVWGGAGIGTGPFALPDCAVAAVAAAAAPGATGGVNRCLNPTDDVADVEWELPLTGFLAGEAFTAIGSVGGSGVSSLTLLAGSNILWAIDTAAAPEAIWTYEDTLAAPVILTSPGNGASVDSEDEVTFTWEDLNEDTVEFYELELNEYDDFSGPDLGATLIDDNDWSTGAGALEAGTTYYWRVTVTDPVSSRTSAEWSFITKVAQVTAPVEVRPLPGAQDVILKPTFAWRPVTGADTYELVIATDAGFTSVVTSATTLINAWEIDVELDYSTVYYWRVRGISASGAPAGDWVISIFTTMAKPAAAAAPVEITQITQPAPIVEITKTEITPAWIWAIIAIGAVLCVAVVILIVRTRRAV